jgi:hypothetical protein
MLWQLPVQDVVAPGPLGEASAWGGLTSGGNAILAFAREQTVSDPPLKGVGSGSSPSGLRWLGHDTMGCVASPMQLSSGVKRLRV